MAKLIRADQGGQRVGLHSPTDMPRACGFLWNREMLLQVNCRGYVTGQHMQPEPARYSHAPIMEERTFMQPEQALYAHHPGRFFYVRDVENGVLFSVPYEPVRHKPDSFLFSVGTADIAWQVTASALYIETCVQLPTDDVVELWTLDVRNDGSSRRLINLYPCFTIGYMSWMNQSARYRPDHGGIVASSVAPYQKLEDYAKVKTFRDLTYLLHDRSPAAWEASRDAFEGEGGIHNPAGVRANELGKGEASYEIPIAALQYRLELAPGESSHFRFLFGPARNDAEISAMRAKYLVDGGFEYSAERYKSFLKSHSACLRIDTPDKDLDGFVNHWLGRQVLYHGDTNRLSTDPQTRNYLQDNMGMVFVSPDVTRAAFCRALGQQEADGSMPDGIVLQPGAELKYINQVPHRDHSVWLPVCLQAYLDETGDVAFLEEKVSARSGGEPQTVFTRICAAMQWLVGNCDSRGLSLIAQGDWCDPMNMVGHKGKGVSGWLTMATVYALRIWSDICRQAGHADFAEQFGSAADDMHGAAQAHLWDGNWFARGITDDGRTFGTAEDTEGAVFLNPQSWAILADVASPDQVSKMLTAIEQRLDTPFGTMMLAPAYTKMHEDIGRITQKHPGSAENGSIYNHAAAFLIFALYKHRDADRAFAQLRRMLPGPSDDDYRQRGQMPVFIPNYYRGAVQQFPRMAGRSSQLFNTGAASWMYRILVECLFGLKGDRDGLRIEPNLPSQWKHATAARRFRGSNFDVEYTRDSNATQMRVMLDDKIISGNIVRNSLPGQHYRVQVVLPG
jgi:cellobionic acid phosphorylase